MLLYIIPQLFRMFVYPNFYVSMQYVRSVLLYCVTVMCSMEYRNDQLENTGQTLNQAAAVRAGPATGAEESEYTF